MCFQNILWCSYVLAVLFFCGCESNNNRIDTGSTSSTFRFVIVEWRRTDGSFQQVIHIGEIPTIETGVQFDLRPQQVGSGKINEFSITDVSDVKFTKNGQPFEPIIVGPTPYGGLFYRIDQQSLTDIYCVKGTFHCPKTNRTFPISRTFRVICPNIQI